MLKKNICDNVPG